MTGNHYWIDSPELCNKFTVVIALRNVHRGRGTTCRFYYNDGIMSLGLL